MTPVDNPHRTIADALRSQHRAGWDEATRRYAEDSWASHELAAGDGSGATRALVAVSSDAAPGASFARWTEHCGAIEELLGAEHPYTLITRNNLAAWRGEAGDAAGAAKEFAKLLPLFEQVLGAEHPDTLNTLNALAYWRAQEQQ